MRNYNNYKVGHNNCWNWQFKYGRVHRYGPYREFYKKFKGDIPKGLCVMHTCDNKHCVNPDHLVLGSQAANGYDASGEGQTKKLLAGIIKEKHFSGIHKLLRRRVEVERAMNM